MPALKYLGQYPIEPVKSVAEIKAGRLYGLGIGTHTIRTFIATSDGSGNRYLHSGKHCDFHLTSDGRRIAKPELKSSPLEVDDFFDIQIPKEGDGSDNFVEILESNGDPSKISEMYQRAASLLK